MATRIEIIKAAASQTGNGPLASVDDDSEVARIADESYETIVAAALCQHRWLWARKAFVLTQLDVEVEAPWREAYQKPPLILATQYLTNSPADSNGRRIVHEERSTADGPAYVVAEEFADTDAVLYAVGTARVDESAWPPDFTKAIQYYVEAALHRGISFQISAAEKREADAEAILQRARARDGNSSTRTDGSEWNLLRGRRRDVAWAIDR